MKEVRLFRLSELAAPSYAEMSLESSTEKRAEVEANLSVWLTAGWRIAGTGGERLGAAFVILVRDKPDHED
jgi:hypothetical protein